VDDRLRHLSPFQYCLSSPGWRCDAKTPPDKVEELRVPRDGRLIPYSRLALKSEAFLIAEITPSLVFPFSPLPPPLS